ncbi:MAG TPA: hypothetical protein VKA36_00120 [Solirubrobacterales bacterium]|nr:hypothetical protein [Solirubrobacterales bacterium]
MTQTRKLLLSLLGTALVAAMIATLASGAMRSQRIDSGVCKTTGGGRFVGIPGFPGEKIDRRLLRDVKRIVRKYKVFITDGYSTDPVHSAKGEHPIGLALDIVPNRAAGGRWRDVGRLARWAEPRQNRPRAPFRWVGYNGDAHHGRGHHLHLSWAHSPAKFGKPARTVYSSRCPRPGSPQGKPPASGKPPKQDPAKQQPSGKGGISPGRSKKGGGDRSAGGVSLQRAKRQIRSQQRSDTSRERGGVGLR